MSSAQRYRTLILYITRVYSATDSTTRTEYMREGLENIMTTLSPLTSSDWEIVMNDVRRLLHVWESKETDSVARSVVLQIEDMLKEFSQPSQTFQPSKVSPKLMISESSRIPVISHVVDQAQDDSECESDVDDTCENSQQITKSEEESEAPEPDVPESEQEDISEPEVEPEVEEEVEEEEEEEEEEDDEPEAEAEAEAEMEVEQITVRGKTYWYDPSSKKLFAVLEDDEVGDEIGILVNGKIQALVKE